jgi:hypothetical protein
MGPDETFAPYQFAPFCSRLDTGVGGGHRTVFAAPPQHGKTECVKTAIARWLVTCANYRFGYGTYGQVRAEKISQQVRRLLEGAGETVEGDRADWYLPQYNTSMIWRGRGSKVTGEPIDGVFIVDDILGGIEEARSPRAREAGVEWYHEDVCQRVHPGASLFVMATRWWEDDLSGVLIDPTLPDKYEYLNFEAICEHPDRDPLHRALGEPLCPRLHPLEELEATRRDKPGTFWAQFQGSPRREQDRVFRDPTYYDSLPSGGYRVAYGVDLAYTAKTSACWSICLKGRVYTAQPNKLYLTGCRRERMASDEFLAVMEACQAEESGPMLFYGSTTEVGQAAIITRRHIKAFKAKLATADKFIRATPASQSWNHGLILVPSRRARQYGAWVEPFVKVVTAFRGMGDTEDDDVDALAALHDLALKLGIKDEPGKLPFSAVNSSRGRTSRDDDDLWDDSAA